MLQVALKQEIGTVFDDLTELFNACSCNDLVLMKASRAINKLLDAKSISPAYYHCARALISAISADRENATSASFNALKLAPKDAHVYACVLPIFAALGEIRASSETLKNILHLFPDDKAVIWLGVTHAYNTFQFSTLRDLLDRFDKLSVNDPVVLSTRRKYMMLSLANASSLGLTDEYFTDRLETAISALRSNKLEVRRMTSLTLNNGQAIVNLHLDHDHQTCAESSFIIAEALVEQFDDPGTDAISIVCRPLFDLDDLRIMED